METLEMKFDLNRLTPEQTKTMEIIEEDMISLLEDELSSSSIRFWKPEERIPNCKIEEKYDPIYSCAIAAEYKKKTKKFITNCVFARNFDYMSNSFANMIYVQLPVQKQNEIISWSRKGFRILSSYFSNKFNYILRGVRFDFIPADLEEETFVLPYLPLCNIRLSQKPNSNIISLNDYIAELTELFQQIANFQKQIST